MSRLKHITETSSFKWVGIILILFFASTAVIASEQHNHNIGEKAIDCPAHILSVTISAWQPADGLSFPPLTASTFAGQFFQTSYVAAVKTPYINKAPPLFS